MAQLTLRDKVIILTGASSGIGEASAYELGAAGAILVLAARREQRLERVAQQIRGQAADVLVVKTDLSKYADVQHLVTQTYAKYKRIDVLLNIAGWGSYSWFEDYKVEDIEQQFAVNVLGASYLIHDVLPIMKAQRSGHIINMVSYASRVATPPLTVYASTKYALEGLSDGLRRELLPWGIRVSRVHPSGVTGTEFNAKASQRGGVSFQSAGIGNISREYVARRLHQLILHPRPELMLGRLYDVPAFINRYFPALVDLALETYVKLKRKDELKE